LTEILFVRFRAESLLLASVHDRRQFGTVQPSYVEAMFLWLLIFVEILVHGKVVGEHVTFEDLQVVLDIGNWVILR
jgi:hypothetical protein